MLPVLSVGPETQAVPRATISCLAPHVPPIVPLPTAAMPSSSWAHCWEAFPGLRSHQTHPEPTACSGAPNPMLAAPCRSQENQRPKAENKSHNGALLPSTSGSSFSSRWYVPLGQVRTTCSLCSAEQLPLHSTRQPCSRPLSSAKHCVLGCSFLSHSALCDHAVPPLAHQKGPECTSDRWRTQQTAYQC